MEERIWDKSERGNRMSVIDDAIHREIRAREAFRMYSNRATYAKIAQKIGVSSPTVKNDINWYISNRATKQEIASIDRRNNLQVKREQKAKERQHKRDERNKWIRSIIKSLMDGMTIKEVAVEVNRSVPTIYKLISSYEKIDPDFVAEYRKIARTHRFGRFSHRND